MTHSDQISSPVGRGIIWRRLVAPLVLFAAVTASAQTSEELTQDGRNALGKGDYVEAVKLFDEARGKEPDEALETKLTFYSAVAQQQAASTADADEKTAMLSNAAELYESYLDGRQDSAALNNLARAYEELGNTEQAAATYRRAIATGDAKSALYLNNYAEFLDRSGMPEEASAAYLDMISTQPLSARQQDEIGNRFADMGRDAYVDYLWVLARDGSARLAVERATQTLLDASGANTTLRSELLAIIAVSLAREPIWPEAAWQDSVRIQLAEIGRGSNGNRGARELLELQDAAIVIHTIARSGIRNASDRSALQNARSQLDPAEFQWWRTAVRPDRNPPRGVWPIDGFRNLIRSHGDGLKQAALAATEGSLPANTIYGLAEDFYRLSANLQAEEVDPQAIRELVRIKVATDDLPGVGQVLDEYERDLFAGKGDAIRNRRLAKTFEYHKTLGEIYTQLSDWGDSSDVQSAIFQLESAREKSLEIEAQTGDRMPEAYQFTPEMVEMLDRAYKAQGQPTIGNQLRLDEARRYADHGNVSDAEKVLRPVENLPAEFEQYRNIDTSRNELILRQDAIERLQDNANEIQPPPR